MLSPKIKCERDGALKILKGGRVEGWEVRQWLCVKLVINIYFVNTECCVFITCKKET